MLENIIIKYEDYLKNNNRMSKSSIKMYLTDINNFKIFINSKNYEKLADIRELDIENYIKFLKEKNRSISTINRNLSSLKSLFEFLFREGIVNENPCLDIKTIKNQFQDIEFLTIDEIEEILSIPDINNFKGARDSAMMELLYSTGIGINEIIALNKKDLDRDFQMISVGIENRRTLPLGRYAFEAIEFFIDNYNYSDEIEALFINQRKNRITRQGLWKSFKEYEKKTEIKKSLNPNIFRHSFAIHMLENGADLETIQEMLGSDDINIIKIYLRKAAISIREDYRNTHPRA